MTAMVTAHEDQSRAKSEPETVMAYLPAESCEVIDRSSAGPAAVESNDARERNDRGFGRSIGDVGNSKPTHARDGRDVDDRPLTPPLHMRKHVLAGQESSD